MPAVSIWMLRLSLVYLLITFITGSVLLLNKAMGFHPVLWALLPVHIEVAILGWILQFVLGTAYWMFPRYLKGPIRGSSTLSWSMIISLNIGIVLSATPLPGTFIPFMGRLFLLTGVILFVQLMWGRVVSYREIADDAT